MFKLALANASRHVLLRSKVLLSLLYVTNVHTFISKSILHFLSMNNAIGISVNYNYRAEALSEF